VVEQRRTPTSFTPGSGQHEPNSSDPGAQPPSKNDPISACTRYPMDTNAAFDFTSRKRRISQTSLCDNRRSDQQTLPNEPMQLAIMYWDYTVLQLTVRYAWGTEVVSAVSVASTSTIHTQMQGTGSIQHAKIYDSSLLCIPLTVTAFPTRPWASKAEPNTFTAVQIPPLHLLMRICTVLCTRR